jgi:uncharacterized membrane protein (UPF0127 family)
MLYPVKIRINDQVFKCEVRHTKSDLEKGMMGRTFPDTNYSMLFIMPTSERQSFWMKNCVQPLDILFISGVKITTIHKNCPPCDEEPCETYEGYGGFVLELNGGACDMYGINEGDRIEII